MGAETFVSNAFVADGVVPEDEGLRTILEFRSRLYAVPSNTRPAPPTPTNESGADGGGMRGEDQSKNGFLAVPDLSESENVHRHLSRYIDVSLLSNFDHRFYSGMKLVPPMYLHGSNIAVIIQDPPRDNSLMGKIRAAVKPYLPVNQPKQEAELSLISWHWAGELVAIGTGPNLDRICGYNFGSGTCETTGERISAIQGIRSIAFRPFGGRHLAVGCSAGVVFLRGQNMEIMLERGHTHVTSLDWSPDGSQLATVSAADGKVRLWDIGTRKSVVVSSGHLVRFCPRRGRKCLFVASADSPSFKLWYCDTWKFERWGGLSGSVVAATWSKDGSTLFFSTEGESAIHVMSVGHELGEQTRVIRGEMTSLPREGPGGTPSLLEIDDSGERLAVAYAMPEDEREKEWKDTEAGKESKDHRRRFPIAIYATQLTPPFQMYPVGYVCGPQGSGPVISLKFKPSANKESVLTCMWRNGEVSFVQLMYNVLHQ